jgi:hypothetical protein
MLLVSREMNLLFHTLDARWRKTAVTICESAWGSGRYCHTISPQYAVPSSLFMLIIGGVGQTSAVAISQVLNKKSVYRTVLLAPKCLQELRFVTICPSRMWDVFLLTGSNVSGETAASIFRIDLFYFEDGDRCFLHSIHPSIQSHYMTGLTSKPTTSRARFQPSSAMQMKSALFWDITQCVVVIPRRRFEATCRFHLQRSRKISGFLDPWKLDR